jgi:hypothetical protein
MRSPFERSKPEGAGVPRSATWIVARVPARCGTVGTPTWIVNAPAALVVIGK